MAKRKMNRNYQKKRKTRGRKYKNPKLIVVKELGGISPVLRTRLAYSTYTYGLLNATNFVQHVFRLNSINDFDYADNLSNIQPQGHDRLADLYARYLVRYVTIIAEVATSGDPYQTAGSTASKSAAGVVVQMGKWLPDDNSAVPSVPAYLESMPGSLTAIIARNNHKRMVWRVPLYKMYGMNVNPLTSDYAARNNTNPSGVVWAAIRVEAPDATSTSVIDFSIFWKFIFEVDYAGPKYDTLNTT